MRWFQLGLLAASFVGSASISQAQPPQNWQTRNGAILGGVTGAVIGGIVGHQSKDTAEGALIGGAVGAVAGGVLGNNRDNMDRQRYQQYQQHQHTHYRSRPVYVTEPSYVQQTYVPVRTTTVPTKVTTRRPVTVSEVITMSQSGVSDSVIVSHIQSNGVSSVPDVNEIIWMSEKGVSDYVITFMQQNSKVTPTTVYSNRPTTVQQSDVIIHEEYRPTTVIHSTPVRTHSHTPVYVERRGF